MFYCQFGLTVLKKYKIKLILIRSLEISGDLKLVLKQSTLLCKLIVLKLLGKSYIAPNFISKKVKLDYTAVQSTVLVRCM